MSSILDALRKVEAERMQAAQTPPEEALAEETAETELLDESPAPSEAAVPIARGRLVAAGVFLGLCLVFIPVSIFYLLNYTKAPESPIPPRATVASVVEAPASGSAAPAQSESRQTPPATPQSAPTQPAAATVNPVVIAPPVTPDAAPPVTPSPQSPAKQEAPPAPAAAETAKVAETIAPPPPEPVAAPPATPVEAVQPLEQPPAASVETIQPPEVPPAAPAPPMTIARATAPPIQVDQESAVRTASPEPEPAPQPAVLTPAAPPAPEPPQPVAPPVQVQPEPQPAIQPPAPAPAPVQVAEAAAPPVTASAGPAPVREVDYVDEPPAAITPIEPVDPKALPELKGSDRVRLGLENMRINVIREADETRPHGVAIINLHKVFVGERIPGTNARLIGVVHSGIAIEMIGAGQRYFVRW